MHLGDALQNLLARNEVESACLIIFAKISPVGTGWSIFPAMRWRHAGLLGRKSVAFQGLIASVNIKFK
jgi:hypothetical protein